MQLFKVEAGAKIADSTGSVRVIRDGAMVYLKAGDSLQGGDVVVLSSSDKVVLNSENNGSDSTLVTHDGSYDVKDLVGSLSASGGSVDANELFDKLFKSSGEGSNILANLIAEDGSNKAVSNSFSSFHADKIVFEPGLSAEPSYTTNQTAIEALSRITGSNYSTVMVDYLTGRGTVVDTLGNTLDTKAVVSVTPSLLTSSVSSASSVISSGMSSVSVFTNSQTININVIISLQVEKYNTIVSSGPGFTYGTSGADYYVMTPGGSNRIDLGAGNDLVVTQNANFTKYDMVIGGDGFDVLRFTDTAIVNNFTGSWANKSGIDQIEFNSSNNVFWLDNYYKSDTGQLIIANANYTVSLKAWDYAHVIVAGEGLVTLASGTNNTIYTMEGVNSNIGLTDWNYWVYGNTGNDTYYAANGNEGIGVIDAGAGYDIIRYTTVANSLDWYFGGKTGIDALQFTVNGNSLVLNSSIVANSDNHVLELLNGTNTITSLNTSEVLAADHVVIAGTGAVTLANRITYDPMTNVVYAKDGVNTFVIGSNADNFFYGGTGNDTYVIGSGVDTVALGAGNDVVVFNSAGITAGDVINGGLGFDTIRIDGAGVQMLLNNIPDTVFQGFEAIDINGTGGNLLVLGLADVLALNDAGVLFIKGGADDEVGFTSNANWVAGADTVVDGITYTAYTAGAAAVYVQNGLSVTGNYSIVNHTYTLTAGADIVSYGAGADTFITSDANFTTADLLNGGLGLDTLVFLDAAHITKDEWARVLRIDAITLNADGNVIDLDLNYVSDTGKLEIQNQGFSITSLAARQISNVVLAGTGLVSLNSSTNNYITIKEGVNANMVLAGAMFSVYGSWGSEHYLIQDAYINSNNTLSAGSGTDTLILQNAASISAGDLINFSGIEVIRFAEDNNSLQLSDKFVSSASNSTVELQNLGYTISNLDTSDVGAAGRVVLGGTGAVTLADGVNNVLYAKDGVDVTVYGGTGNDIYYMGSGTETVDLGAGNDTVIYSLSSLSAGDVIKGGADSGLFGYGDTIHIGASDTGQLLDFTSIGDNVFQGFEVIDMNGDYRVDGVQLLSSDVIALTGTGILFIRGDNSSQVGLLNSDIGTWSQLDDFTLDGITYHVYSSTVDMATVYVQSGVEVFINSLLGLSDTVTLTSDIDNWNLGLGNDLIITDNASFNSGDTIIAGLGFDTLRFTDAAIIDHNTNSWWNKAGIDRIEFSADGNVLLLDGYYRSDSGMLEIDNSTYSLYLKAWDYSHVVIAGTGLVTLGSGTNNVVYTAAGVDTNIQTTDWNYWIYGNTGNDTIHSTSNNFIVGIIDGGAGFDVVEFENAANLLDYQFNGKSGIDALRFTADGNYIALNNDIVSNSDNHMLEIQNQGYSVTLTTKMVQDPSINKVVIAGTGDVFLASYGLDMSNEVYAKDGVDTHVFGTDGAWVTNTFHGGTGNDTYTLDKSTDIVSLGEGQDVFNFKEANFSANDRIDGGGASDNTLGLGDILRFTASNQSLDLTGLNNDVIKGIEIIDLHGGNNNTLTLHINDVLALSDTTDDLVVMGNANNNVNLSTAHGNWTLQGSTQNINGIDYKVYVSDTADDARVLIDNNVNVIIS